MSLPPWTVKARFRESHGNVGNSTTPITNTSAQQFYTPEKPERSRSLTGNNTAFGTTSLGSPSSSEKPANRSMKPTVFKVYEDDKEDDGEFVEIDLKTPESEGSKVAKVTREQRDYFNCKDPGMGPDTFQFTSPTLRSPI